MSKFLLPIILLSLIGILLRFQRANFNPATTRYSQRYTTTAVTDSAKIIYSVRDSIDDFLVIPPDAFQRGATSLVMTFEFDTIPVTNKTGIQITWPSPNIDGRYVLTITPRQIYLKSSHDNPNSNYLYWLTPIHKDQYSHIKEHLATQNNTLEYSANQYTPYHVYLYAKYKEEELIKEEWTDKRYENLVALLEMINKSLSPTNDTITIPKEDSYESKHAVRLVLGIEQ
jgi:predicted house-cleaning noncanonical NTP pyrophosphatase (MazG superfamily)